MWMLCWVTLNVAMVMWILTSSGYKRSQQRMKGKLNQQRSPIIRTKAKIKGWQNWMCAWCTVGDHTCIGSVVLLGKRTVIDGGGISFIIGHAALLNNSSWRSHRSVLLESPYHPPLDEIHVVAAALPPPHVPLLDHVVAAVPFLLLRAPCYALQHHHRHHCRRHQFLLLPPTPAASAQPQSRWPQNSCRGCLHGPAPVPLGAGCSRKRLDVHGSAQSLPMKHTEAAAAPARGVARAARWDGQAIRRRRRTVRGVRSQAGGGRHRRWSVIGKGRKGGRWP